MNAAALRVAKKRRHGLVQPRRRVVITDIMPDEEFRGDLAFGFEESRSLPVLARGFQIRLGVALLEGVMRKERGVGHVP